MSAVEPVVVFGHPGAIGIGMWNNPCVGMVMLHGHDERSGVESFPFWLFNNCFVAPTAPMPTGTLYTGDGAHDLADIIAAMTSGAEFESMVADIQVDDDPDVDFDDHPSPVRDHMRPLWDDFLRGAGL